VLVQQVIPSFQKLYDYFTQDYLPHCRQTIGLSSLPDGKAWYEYNAKVSTTTDLSPRMIHELGLHEVERIKAEMQKVIVSSQFKGDFKDFCKFLSANPKFFYNDAESLVSGYRDVAKRIDAELPRLFGKLPRNPYGVKPVPAYSEKSQPTAYYENGSVAAGRAGIFRCNTYDLRSRPKWQMEVLTAHEAVPGHHLQISLAQEMEDAPDFRKYSNYTAFIEGWGLYSESLGYELGLYQDVYSKFGQLSAEMWRAVRLVVDTGMHYYGWTRQQAIDYFNENTGKSGHDSEVEIDRYIVWPGQALAYKIGQLKFKQLRELAKNELGAKFDVRSFHDHLLDHGAVPLDLLEKQVREWIEAVKKSK
jgi:uncharacterized protein (DUF885 family)